MKTTGPANKRKGSKKGKAPKPPKKAFGATIGYAEPVKKHVPLTGSGK